MHSRRILATIYLSTSIIAACKMPVPGNISEQKTLDNFAAQDLVSVNSCSGSNVVRPALSERIVVNKISCAQIPAQSPDKKFCHDVQAYLSAVPVEVQDAFLAMGGSISVRPDSAQLCGDIMSRENSPQFAPAAERQKIDSCFMFVQGKAGSKDAGKSVLTLVHSMSSENIRHNGVRLFGFLYAQFVPRLNESVDVAGRKTFAFDARLPLGNAFETYKTDLARNFFTDVYNLEKAGGKIKVSNLAPLIGSEGAARIIANLNAGKVDVFEGLTFGQSPQEIVSATSRQFRLQRIKDFIFAETFDSLVCSNQTRQVAARDFKKTHDFFAELLPVIKERSRLLSSSSAASASSFGLVAKSQNSATADAKAKLSLAGEEQYLLQMLLAAFQQVGAGMGAKFSSMDPSVNQLGSLLAGGDDLLSSCPNCNCSSGNCSGCSGGSCQNCASGSCGQCAGCSGAYM